MGLLQTIAAGMASQQVRVAVAASNISNARTTRNLEGSSSRRLSTNSVSGDTFTRVDVTKNAVDLDLVYSPGRLQGDNPGGVACPNVDVAREMVDMREAARMYKANAVLMKTAQEMDNTLLDMFA